MATMEPFLLFPLDDDLSYPPMASGERSKPLMTPPASPWVPPLETYIHTYQVCSSSVTPLASVSFGG